MIVMIAALGCGSSRNPTTTPAERSASITVDIDRFPHAKHTGSLPEIANWKGRGLGCADCHELAAVLAGTIARPGMQQHAPCDDCHKAEFGKPPGPLCKVCHSAVDPMRRGASPLQAYPARGASQSLASTFSHRLHLDADDMERATGAHVACGDCHQRDEQTRDPKVPDHAACARCHEAVPAVKAKLGMANCTKCHATGDINLPRGRLFIVGDLTFHHADHETDKAGAKVACTTCHEGVDQSSSRQQMSVPPMVRCAQCHEDASRSPDRVRMSNCNVCHSNIAAGSPPSSHMVGGSGGGERPIDHTLVFRKHHGDQAASKDANCRFCHQEVTGAAEDSCFQCHQVMRPRDHTLMFREDHGRDAQADSDRCAACHAPETCAACHSVPPRSHTPIGEFRQGGHAEQARFGLTACLTCHTYEDTCSRCHRGTR